ncbi:nitroreductase family protein [Fulvivirga sedimenti]|uniref:Nitroreductase family protein n=1 Tax=Fulvivirga sedimenti TaxID=2879465 RepID=A0A9X1HTE2_9BACT|nr:nitroreductase family protein [Fulvivirga sedimenti]MCA6075275.1 nitroreductase family protein [Fulvivirga sedimenti]MCA6076452.1 nitroreductase family protein [Fulvivirga sedimenti]MCA6077580.1 nitroreductase family protein [Fulvivirga sedimenti]
MMIETIDIKQAKTRYNVLDVIRKRWSPRSFSKYPLMPEEIETLLEAATWAPSAMNEQPWRFVVASKEDEEKFRKLADFLVPGNRVWAENAAVLMVVFGVTTYARNGKENINVGHDVGMATQNLLLQGVSMDVYGHVMEGFDKDRVIEEFQLPDNIRPLTMLALGRLDVPDLLEEPYYSREQSPRTRRSVEDSVISFPEM